MGELVQVKDLKVWFEGSGETVRAVDGVSFAVRRGETFGLVGESGSGKTLTALSILRLVTPPGRIASGSIVFDGRDVMAMNEEELRGLRGSKAAMVFQEPASAFNPVFTVGYQVAEAVTVHQGVDARKAQETALDFLHMAHIPDPRRIYHSYPHQLSGGTKQRAMIAMALVNSPELLILDEPTTALDVTVQAQILDLLEEIRRSRRLSMLFISHDLGVIARMCGRVAVMRSGKVVEEGETAAILRAPKEPYTKSLLDSVRAIL